MEPYPINPHKKLVFGNITVMHTSLKKKMVPEKLRDQPKIKQLVSREGRIQADYVASKPLLFPPAPSKEPEAERKRKRRVSQSVSVAIH